MKINPLTDLEILQLRAETKETGEKCFLIMQVHPYLQTWY
jgi:hypothetical protein